MGDMQQHMRAFGHQVTRDKVLLSMWRSLLDIMQHWDLTMKQLWPICAVCFILAWFLARMTSLMRSTSCWYFLRSLMALSLASLRADSRIFTRSAVARRRFSSLGSSHLKSALSRTSYESNRTINIILYYNINDLYVIVYYICNFCTKLK